VEMTLRTVSKTIMVALVTSRPGGRGTGSWGESEGGGKEWAQEIRASRKGRLQGPGGEGVVSEKILRGRQTPQNQAKPREKTPTPPQRTPPKNPHKTPKNQKKTPQTPTKTKKTQTDHPTDNKGGQRHQQENASPEHTGEKRITQPQTKDHKIKGTQPPKPTKGVPRKKQGNKSPPKPPRKKGSAPTKKKPPKKHGLKAQITSTPPEMRSATTPPNHPTKQTETPPREKITPPR